jgi:cold shock protein
MPKGEIKLWNEERGFGFIRPEGGGQDVFFHVTALREGDEMAQGAKVVYEEDIDKKTGKTKAISVDLM